MRVVHVIKATRIAGAERHLITLLPGLRARGIDARLILLYAPAHPVNDLADALTMAGVPVARIPIRHHADTTVIGRIRDSLRADTPSIVHSHLIHADLFASIASMLARVPHRVISRHNDDPFRRRLPIALANRTIWGMADAGIAISESIRAFCIQVEGAAPDKITTIHYGLPPQPAPDSAHARMALRQAIAASSALDNETPIVGFVGRLIAQKGGSDALRAFALLDDAHRAARLVIVGDGDLRSALEAEAAALGIRARTHFLGWRDDAAGLMAGFDIFLMPSLWEGFGLVLLEAMAAALPIVASNVSAIPEVVAHGETGLLVPPRDPAALAQAIDLLLSDTPLRRHLGLVGQERGESVFSAARMIDATVALYERIAPNG